jgi:hypothetical protein
MLRKMLVIGALAVVAGVLGAGNAWAHPKLPTPAKQHMAPIAEGSDGFSDGRLFE